MSENPSAIVGISEKSKIKFLLRPGFDPYKTGNVFDLLRDMGDVDNRDERNGLGKKICELLDDVLVDKSARLVDRLIDNAIPLVFIVANLATAEVFEHLTVTHPDACPSVPVRGSESGILEYMARRQPMKDDQPTSVSGCNSSADRLEIYRLLIQKADTDLCYDARDPSYNFANLFSGNARKQRRFEVAVKAWIRNRQALITMNDNRQLLPTLKAAIEQTQFPSPATQGIVDEAAHVLVSAPKIIKRITGKLPKVKGTRLLVLDERQLDLTLISEEEKRIARINTAVLIWRRAIHAVPRKSIPDKERIHLLHQGHALILKM